MILSDAIKVAMTAWLAMLVTTSLPAVATDEVDDTIYVPSPKFDWDARVRQAAVASGDMITLVVHSAGDCVYCARWKGSLGGEGHFRSWANDHRRERLIVVERGAISSSETPQDYPQELNWLADRYQRDQRLKPITPTFEVFVEHNLVFRSHGLHSWDEKVFPAIKNLESRRPHSAEGEQ